MKVAFRVDASIEIGNGHVMRCLTLAEALRKQGAQCSFIGREHSGNLLGYISERGFNVHKLPASINSAFACKKTLSDHAAWLGENWEIDADQTCIELGEQRVDWLVIDHYAIDSRWEKKLRPTCNHLMVIDDLANRQHDCDLLLDQNLGRNGSDYNSLLLRQSLLLIGTKYSLLRPEFSTHRGRSLARRHTPSLKRILITMGGVDTNNATGNILSALVSCPLPSDCKITVVLGPNAPWIDSIFRQALHMPWATAVLVNVRDMANLMADSDLAIGAAGSTSWERCALGLPTYVTILAENQKEAAQALADKGAAEIIPPPPEMSNALTTQFRKLLEAPEHLRHLSENAAKICDGEGLNRTLLEMVKLSNTLRKF